MEYECSLRIGICICNVAPTSTPQYYIAYSVDCYYRCRIFMHYHFRIFRTWQRRSIFPFMQAELLFLWDVQLPLWIIIAGYTWRNNDGEPTPKIRRINRCGRELNGACP